MTQETKAVKFAAELISGNVNTTPDAARHIAARLIEALTTLGWTPPDAQAKREQAADA